MTRIPECVSASPELLDQSAIGACPVGSMCPIQDAKVPKAFICINFHFNPKLCV